MLRLLLDGIARVSAFTVHEPPQTSGTRLERAESLLFVADGFSWRAALFSPFYLLLRGQWLALAAYAAAAVVLWLLLAAIGAGNQWFTLIFLVLNVIAGFEASELKRWSLGRAGWQEIATVSGRGQEDAERRFFEAWLPSVPDGTPSQVATERHSGAGPWSSPRDDATSRIEASVRRLSERLRSKFALKS